MTLRPFDAEGVEVFGIPPAEALSHAARMSTEHFVMLVDDEVVAAWGYASHSLAPSTAYGWMLTSPLVDANPMRFLRQSRRAVEYILSRALRLEVTVLKAHDTSIIWLEWLGFTRCGETDTFLSYEKVR